MGLHQTNWCMTLVLLYRRKKAVNAPVQQQISGIMHSKEALIIKASVDIRASEPSPGNKRAVDDWKLI